ncbi:MAG: hypothetical protein NC311_12855 [Muribaculaceae bacterium]|nr:hypothetical protein [Muribaculaceae bacterium]MCM1439959.1 hypothetical protein [Roseburia sp.]
MQLKWRRAEGTQAEKPKEIDTAASPFSVYIRKNIQQETRAQPGGDSITVWAYDEAVLTLGEYAQYQKELAECDSLSQRELVENNLVVMGAIAESFEQQITAEENQLIIMGAIAEMFESITDAIADIKEITERGVK